MAKKEITTEKANLMDTRWINTPFAFVRVGKNFSLLQQQIMLKVSDHLQDYLTTFYKERRNMLPEDPLSLFNDATMKSIPVLKIPYSDFNVDVNNRKDLYDAIDQVLSVRIRGLVLEADENGIPVQKWAWMNVFKRVTTKVQNASDVNYRTGTFDLSINEDVAAYAFNMRLGYINHPSRIAEESTKVYAPKLYFIIKHRLRRGKPSVVIPYEELREELGMIKYHDEEDSPADKPVVEKILYPIFSRFEKNVLMVAVEDINRMAELNLLDICIRYDVNYPPGVTKGNPESITFHVSLSSLGEFHKDPKHAMQHMEDSRRVRPEHAVVKSLDVEEVNRRRGRPRKVVAQDLFSEPDYSVQILDDMRYILGDGQMGYDYYFGASTTCRIEQGNVIFGVSKWSKETIENTPSIIDRIKRIIAKYYSDKQPVFELL